MQVERQGTLHARAKRCLIDWKWFPYVEPQQRQHAKLVFLKAAADWTLTWLVFAMAWLHLHASVFLCLVFLTKLFFKNHSLVFSN